jgi:hypothetical protein
LHIIELLFQDQVEEDAMRVEQIVEIALGSEFNVLSSLSRSGVERAVAPGRTSC